MGWRDWVKRGALAAGTGGLSEGYYLGKSALKYGKQGLGYIDKAMTRGSDYAGVDKGNFNLPGYQGMQNNYGNLARQWGNEQAPQAGYSQFRQGQQDFGQQLLAETQGRGIGQQLVGMQAKNAADLAARQQLSQAAAAPASMQAASARNAAFNTGNIQSQVGGQAALAGGQMQLGALDRYGGFLQGARGQDEAMNQFNVQSRLQQTQLNRDAALEAYRQRLMAAQMQQQGGMGYENNRTQRYGIDKGVPSKGEIGLATAGEVAGFALQRK